jgi:16S rRNA (guanine966-N2)-methyltransferase
MANHRVNRPERKVPGTSSRNIRIIGGNWRRRQLAVPSRPGLRPTPNRVRETLFNWLADDLEGAVCLDLFAGSGALGFEAASRGAGRVVLVERDAQLARHLQAQADLLDARMVQVVCADAIQWLACAAQCFDVVFVDPPYGSLDLPSLMSALHGHALVNGASKVYAEDAASDDRPIFPQHWSVLRKKRTGRVRYTLAAPPNL